MHIIFSLQSNPKFALVPKSILSYFQSIDVTEYGSLGHAGLYRSVGPVAACFVLQKIKRKDYQIIEHPTITFFIQALVNSGEARIVSVPDIPHKKLP